MEKKAMSAIVSTSLLLVVTIVAIMSYQSWYGSYSSNIFSSVEKSSNEKNEIGIETLIGNQLYLKSQDDENVLINQIIIGDKECNISKNISSGMNNIDLSDCLADLILDDSIGEITVVTDRDVITKKHLFSNVSITSNVIEYHLLGVNYNSAPSGEIDSQTSVLINVSANETIKSCSLNFNGTINSSFVINGTNCWIYQPITDFGDYFFNVSVVSQENGEATTITQSFSNIEIINWFGDESDGDILVNSTGVFQSFDDGGSYSVVPDSTGTMWNSVEDGDMVVINAKDFTVENGVSFSVTNRCRGLIIYVSGDMIVNGTINMTARGAHANPADSTVTSNTPVVSSDGNAVPSEGLVIRRVKTDWSDIDSTIISNAHASTLLDFNGTHFSNDLFYGAGNAAVLSEANQVAVTNGLVVKIPRVGGSGGLKATVSGDYNDAIPKMFALAGGGTGQAADSGTYSYTASAGAGGDGTCFSGGSGSGLGYEGHSPDADDYGGPGGQGVTNVAGWMLISGAGNPGGTNANQDGYMFEPEDGTGGLLLVFIKDDLRIDSQGKFESKGVIGGYNNYHPPGYMCGGSSGSGLIGLFYSGILENNGVIDVNAVRAGGYAGHYGGGGVGSIIGPIKIDK